MWDLSLKKSTAFMSENGQLGRYYLYFIWQRSDLITGATLGEFYVSIKIIANFEA
jgi:hypothetical protein